MNTHEFYELLLKYPDAKIGLYLTNTLYKGKKYFSTNFSESIKNGKISSDINIELLDKQPRRNGSYKYLLRFIRKFKNKNKSLSFTHKKLEKVIFNITFDESNNMILIMLTGQPIQKNILEPSGEICDAISKLPEADQELIYNYGYFPSLRRLCGYVAGAGTSNELKQFFIAKAERDVKIALEMARKESFFYRLTHLLG